jgi:hypothetical protein
MTVPRHSRDGVLAVCMNVGADDDSVAKDPFHGKAPAINLRLDRFDDHAGQQL